MNTDTILLIIGLVGISLLISGFIVLLDYLSKRKLLVIDKRTIRLGYWELDDFHGWSFPKSIPRWLKRRIQTLTTKMYKEGIKATIIQGKRYDYIISFNINDESWDGSIFKRWHK